MPVAEIVDGRITVRTQYHERHLVQKVPGARYEKNAGYWTAPLSWATCIALRGIFGSDLSTGVLLTEWSWEIYNNRIKPVTDLRNAMELSPDDPIAQIIDIVEKRQEGMHEAA
jgi:hypothetical protein